MDELISRQAAIDALTTYIYNVYKVVVGETLPAEDCRNAAESVIGELPPVQPKNGTLIIPLNESDFKSVKRIMLDNKPWCRTFYEDVPGEAHWIKSYTPDDGEIYECDNCGVTWQFNDGGPEENKAFFCPKCGFKMVPKEGETE